MWESCGGKQLKLPDDCVVMKEVMWRVAKRTCLAFSACELGFTESAGFPLNVSLGFLVITARPRPRAAEEDWRL